jgi:hypothetical protein
VTLLGLRHGAWMAEGRLTKAERAWLALARDVDPLEIVCTPEESGAWWPALAGRALEPPPWTPVVYRDELSRAIPRRCRTLQPSGR